MPPAPTFRHDPVKSVLPGRVDTAYRWDHEPAVTGYRKLTHPNADLGVDVPVPVSATPAIVTGVGVVVASDDGRVRLFGAGLATAYWERRLDSGIYASVVVDRARRHVVVAATSGLVVCLDLRGTLVWSAQVGAPVYATPTLLPVHDLLVLATFGSRCVGVDLDTGRIRFEQQLSLPWTADVQGLATHRDVYASPVATGDDTVLVAGADRTTALSPTGTTRWSVDHEHTVKASPVMVDATGEVLVCDVRGVGRFLNAASGELVAAVPLGAKVTASPALSGDVVAVGAADGALTGIDVRSHEPVWRAQHAAPRSYTSVSVLPDGAFTATTAAGNVMCRNAADGGFRWESGQELGLADHDTALHITSVAGPDGVLYAASYEGDLYEYRFPTHATGESRPKETTA